MKTNLNRTFALVLTLCLVLSLCACGENASSGTPGTPPPVFTPSQNNDMPSGMEDDLNDAPELDAALQINIMTLSGTTGFGMAGLISDVKNDDAPLNYSITVETDASNVAAALINGSADIAALPTNAAAMVYNKTEGDVLLLALNTLGVLYLVGDADFAIESFEDLRGMTIYCPAQNPSVIFSYLCTQNGLIPGEDIFIDNTYAQPADLRAALASGQIEIAVLPEPLVTAALASGEGLSVLLDLTEQWDLVSPAGSLVQGCVVVRREFFEAHPAELLQFLRDYETSVSLLSEDVAAAAEAIVDAGIFTSAAVAERAIPKCNPCFITGADMKSAMGAFLEIMFEIAPASIGGAIPDDEFYCIVSAE